MGDGRFFLFKIILPASPAIGFALYLANCDIVRAFDLFGGQHREKGRGHGKLGIVPSPGNSPQFSVPNSLHILLDPSGILFAMRRFVAVTY